MFVPFLTALGTAIMTMYSKKNISYLCWTILFIITLLISYHHVILL